MSILEVKNICKTYGTNTVLQDICFSAEKGEVVAIIGSSGSGKTTLLRCLNFLVTPDGGSISVNGETLFDADDTTSYNEEDIRKNRLHFGLVFQQFNLFPQYTVKENVMLAPKLALKEKCREVRKTSGAREAKIYREEQEKAIEEKALSLIERVGLSEKLDFYPNQLSGGQSQRVAIARALMLDPDILCFDEPTSALDPELTGEVLKVIKGLKSSDRTMVVVTHAMDFAKNVADKVIFMSGGVIVEEGTPKEVFDSPKTEALKSFLSKSIEDMDD